MLPCVRALSLPLTLTLNPPASNPAQATLCCWFRQRFAPLSSFQFLFTFASILHDTVIMPVRVACPSLGELHIHMLTEWRGCTTGEARAELQGALRTNRARIRGPHARTPGVVHLRVHGPLLMCAHGSTGHNINI